jgi:hypothetical protein
MRSRKYISGFDPQAQTAPATLLAKCPWPQSAHLLLLLARLQHNNNLTCSSFHSSSSSSSSSRSILTRSACQDGRNHSGTDPAPPLPAACCSTMLGMLLPGSGLVLTLPLPLLLPAW